MSARDFPADEILLARGRYATLSAERRAALKAMHADMMALSEIARRIVRALGEQGSSTDIEFIREQIVTAASHVGAAHGHQQTLVALTPELAALKPLAWGKEKVTDE